MSMKEVQHIINKNKEAAATPDGIVVIGKNYSVVVFNEAASRITGFTQRDVLNKDASILFQNCPEGLSHLESQVTAATGRRSAGAEVSQAPNAGGHEPAR